MSKIGFIYIVIVGLVLKSNLGYCDQENANATSETTSDPSTTQEQDAAQEEKRKTSTAPQDDEDSGVSDVKEAQSSTGNTKEQAQPKESVPVSEPKDDDSVAGTTDTTAEDTSEHLPPECQPGQWSLKGADFRSSESSQVVFNKDWLPILEQVAQCMKNRENSNSCIQVQGQYDKIPFSAGIVQAFGNMEAAQTARGLGRAGVVISKLFRMGAPVNRIREIPPPTEPTYRGVEITYIEECTEMMSLHTRQTDQTTGDTTIQYIMMPQSDKSTASERPKPDKSSKFWVELGLDFNLITPNPDTVPSAGLANLGGGWQKNGFYVRLNTELLYGGTEENRWGFKAAAAAGYIPLSWLRLGVFGGYRINTQSFSLPWFEQSGFFGIEVTERIVKLWKGAAICLRQGVGPLGIRHRRAYVTAEGQVKELSEEYHWMLVLEAGLFIRQELDIFFK